MGRKSKVFRPHIDDVECLSYGKGSKKQRGTGSRMVCHRLNQHERKIYEFAKQASILTVRGTGYRKNRKGSPLCNIFRQRCDALEEICIIIEKRADLDRVVIDFSTLRVKNDDKFVAQILDNVLQEKYPHQYAEVIKNHGDIHNHDKESHHSPPLNFSPIKWNEVQINPIWGVDERLIIVYCERDVAKSLAIDVLNESSNFYFDSHNEEDEELVVVENIENSDSVDHDITQKISSQNIITEDDDSIDWDDI